MFRRLFWMIVGASAALWGRAKVLRTIEKYIPARVVRAAKRTATNIARDFVEAGKESKVAMAERERELRDAAASKP